MNCLSYDQIDALLCGTTSAQEQITMLEHVSLCDSCAEALALQTDQLPRVEPPKGMIPQVLSETHIKSKQESLARYSLRVIAAMAAALILLFSGAFSFLLDLPKQLPELQQSIQSSITEFFDFTQGGLFNAPKPQ